MNEFYTLDDLESWKDAPYAIRLGVFGDPVAHSLSPPMQNAALVACEILARYARFHICPDELAHAVRRARDLGFTGLNLTVPHKIAGLQLLDELDGSARDAGSVNTIVFRDRRAMGFNTDGAGFVDAVSEVWPELPFAQSRVLVLGAGGAGRAILAACRRAGCEKVSCWNRTAGKFPVVESLAVAVDEAQLIVNATSVGLNPADLSLIRREWLRPDHFVYDTIYSSAVTPLLAEARAAGAQTANGLPMLLHQGARAFELWSGHPAPIEEMRRALWLAAGVT